MHERECGRWSELLIFWNFFFSGNTSKFIECSEQFRQFSDAFVASGKY